MWLRYSFAEVNGRRFLLLFNVYGAAMMLEALQLLNDGGTKSVFFVGSAGAEGLGVGTIVFPTQVIDRAGVVQVDTKGDEVVAPPESESELVEKALIQKGWGFTKAKVVSVPAVMHGIDHITDFVRMGGAAEVHEMELSTFYHFAKKIGLRAYGLVYVSDNQKHSIISGGKNLLSARREAQLRITQVAQVVLS